MPRQSFKGCIFQKFYLPTLKIVHCFRQVGNKLYPTKSELALSILCTYAQMQISAIYLWGLCEKPGGSFPNSWWRMLKSASLSEYNVGVGVLGHFAANQNWALDTGDGPSKAELRQKHDPRPGLMSREGGRERLLAATCFWINVNKDKISGSYLYYVILANIHHWSSWGREYAAKSESVFNMP